MITDTKVPHNISLIHLFIDFTKVVESSQIQRNLGFYPHETMGSVHWADYHIKFFKNMLSDLQAHIKIFHCSNFHGIKLTHMLNQLLVISKQFASKYVLSLIFLLRMEISKLLELHYLLSTCNINRCTKLVNINFLIKTFSHENCDTSFCIVINFQGHCWKTNTASWMLALIVKVDRSF